MKIAVVGAGAMGSVFGAHLASGGEDVTLIDVSHDTVENVRKSGLRLDDRDGASRMVPLRAATDPAEVGPVDLVLVFVKCYHTEDAARAAAPLLGPETAVLSLQNGWGNAPRIAGIVGQERVLAGVTYHSATVIAPGHVHHTARGVTVLGEIDGAMTPRLSRIAAALSGAGFEVRPTAKVVEEIWSKLALNCCTLPTSAVLRFLSGDLIRERNTAELMRGLLREVVAVANAQDIPIAYGERWETIRGLLERAGGGKSSMLQDVEKGRRTEIDVVNGAVVEAGRRLAIPTPMNDAMVWLVRSLEGSLARKG